MRNTRCLVTVFSMLLMVSPSFLVCPSYAAAGQASLMTALPENTLFCVRINNFTNTLGQMDQYLAGTSPIPLSMTINMLLSGILGDPTMNGINKYGTFAVVGIILEDQAEPAVAFLVPTTDLKQYTSNPNCQGPDENGIYTMNGPNSSVGPIIFIPIINNSYLLIGTPDQSDTLLSIQAVLKEKKTSLTDTLNTVDAENAASAPVWAWLNLKIGYDLAAPFIHKGFEEGMKAQTEKGMGDQKKIAEGLMTGVDEWMQQSDSLSVVLTPQSDLLSAEFYFIAKEDSELAKTLVRSPDTKTGFTLGGYLNPEAQINGLMNMNKPLWIKANEKVLALLTTAVSGSESPDLMTKIKSMMDLSMKAMGSEIAFSFGYNAGTPPFSMREVVAINDQKALQEMLQESSSMVSELYGEMGLPMTFHIEQGVETYKGFTLDTVSIRMDLSENSSEQEKIQLETLYGKEGLTYPLAISKDRLMLTMGPNTDENLKKLIDTSSSLPSMPVDMQSAMKIIPHADTADFVMSINVVRLIKGFAEMMAKAAPQGTPIPPFGSLLEGIQMNAQSAMAVGAHIEKGQIRTTVALPKQELMEIMAVVMQIQQKVMLQQMQQQMQQQQQQQQGTGSGTPGWTPPDTSGTK